LKQMTITLKPLLYTKQQPQQD